MNAKTTSPYKFQWDRPFQSPGHVLKDTTKTDYRKIFVSHEDVNWLRIRSSNGPV
jgi:hypothetical protein